MRILHVISSGGMYGAEAVILDLSRALRQLGLSVEIGVFANSQAPNVDLEIRARSEGFRTHILPCSGQLDPAVPGKLRRLIKAESFDVVHAHGYKADVYAFWALRGSQTALVSTCHNWLDNSLPLRMYGRLDRFLLRRFHRVVAVSEEIQERLLGAGVPKRRIALIRNGVGVLPFAAIPRKCTTEVEIKPVRFGVAARLSPEKGVDVFLHAASQVQAELPGAEFVVGGEGPERARLEALVNDLGLRSRASLPGRLNDMPTFYAGLDVAVLPSHVEGLPMALLEAMASGLPVIASGVGEIPQVVQHGRTGLLVPPGNSEALANAMQTLLRDDKQRHAMGAAARARVIESFSGVKMTNSYVETYTQALAEVRA